jgi:hypothetical protein
MVLMISSIISVGMHVMFGSTVMTSTQAVDLRATKLLPFPRLLFSELGQHWLRVGPVYIMALV